MSNYQVAEIDSGNTYDDWLVFFTSEGNVSLQKRGNYETVIPPEVASKIAEGLLLAAAKAEHAARAFQEHMANKADELASWSQRLDSIAGINRPN